MHSRSEVAEIVSDLMRSLFVAWSVVTTAIAEERFYVFSYFYGDARQNEGLHLAVSTDGLNWKPIADDASLFHPGFGERFRDPALVRDPDGTRIHMVWTCETPPHSFGIATTTDLLRWTDVRQIPVMKLVDKTLNTWAPELFWDASAKYWLAYWGSSVEGRFPTTARLARNPKANNRMYYAVSRDLKTWTLPRLLADWGFPSNDGFLVATPSNPLGAYTLFVKQIEKPGLQARIRLAFGNTPTGPFVLTDEFPSRNYQFCEGPCVITIGDAYFCFFDLSREDRMAVTSSTQLAGKAWEDFTGALTLPEGAKHGSILEIDRATFERLLRHRVK